MSYIESTLIGTYLNYELRMTNYEWKKAMHKFMNKREAFIK